MPKVKHFRARLDRMTDATYALLRGALLLSCTMVICAWALLYYASGGMTVTGFAAYKSAQELITLGAASLFLATIGSAFVEALTQNS